MKKDNKKSSRKALIVTSVASMIDQFLFPSIKLLRELGYETSVCCNFEKGNTCDEETISCLKQRINAAGADYIHVDFERNIFDFQKHVEAYFQLKKILKEDHYHLIHCHSPIGGFLTRLIIPRKHPDQRVIYTAHGFHFYKGAPLRNWFMFYPIEKYAAGKTDILITINTEDYQLAQRKMKAKNIIFIPGVGINIHKPQISPAEISEFRESIGVPKEDTLLLSVGELNKNKNHTSVIDALSLLHQKHPTLSWQYFICGQGGLEKKLQKQIHKYGLDERIHLVGYTSQIKEFLSAADLFIHPSFREGLSVALMEAIAAGVPVVCSNIRGNQDLVDPIALFDPRSVPDIEGHIELIFHEQNKGTDGISQSLEKAPGQRTEKAPGQRTEKAPGQTLHSMACYSAENLQRYSLENVNQALREIYTPDF